ncbi:hypothetical protein ABIF97_004179 [Bradyrhizobium japonicum]
MDHENAPLTPNGREAIVRSVVEGGLPKADALLFNVTAKTVAKWVTRLGCHIEPVARAGAGRSDPPL